MQCKYAVPVGLAGSLREIQNKLYEYIDSITFVMSKDLTQNFISLHNIGTATLYESKSINMLSNKVSTIKKILHLKWGTYLRRIGKQDCVLFLSVYD